jgi:hypothetical protein
MKLIVRWDSARPARLVAKSDLEGFAENYVITISGLPAIAQGPEGRESSQDSLSVPEGITERFTDVPTFQTKGRNPISPEQIEILGGRESPTIRFAFLRTSNPIELREEQVTFSTQIDPAAIKARFVLKDMIFADELGL